MSWGMENNELGDGTERRNQKLAKCAGTPNSYTTTMRGPNNGDRVYTHNITLVI